MSGLSRLLDEGVVHDEGWVAERGEAVAVVETAGVLPATITAAVRAAGAFDSPPAVATVASWHAATEGVAAVVVPPRRVWVRHRIRPRERLSQIAARYGTTTEEIAADNHLDRRDKTMRHFRRVRVRANRIPAPRIKVHYVVQEDQDWGDVATALRVERADLHAWNWQTRSLTQGQELVAWVDPDATVDHLRPGQGPAIPATFDVPKGGESVGRPHRGRLTKGVLLPESELYTRRTPTHGLWGSSHTILQIQRAFATFRHDTAYDGAITIGAISRQHGRRFFPHLSHQSGRDIDIRLPLKAGVPATDNPNPDEIDWYATWGLVEAFIATGEVDVIFLEIGLHRRLYEAARVLGESEEDLTDVLQWPSWDGRARPYVRHSRGHDTHIHVRVSCGPDERRCRRK